MTRPIRMPGYTELIKCGCGKLYITLNKHPEGYHEVFMWLGKAGGCAISHCDSMGRLITKVLNSGVPPEEIVKALKGVRCPSPMWSGGNQVLSCSDAISWVLGCWQEGLIELAETMLKFNVLEVQDDSITTDTGSNYDAVSVDDKIKED